MKKTLLIESGHYYIKQDELFPDLYLTFKALDTSPLGINSYVGANTTRENDVQIHLGDYQYSYFEITEDEFLIRKIK
tara:strand:- start:1764 stop:1994 length:231 start_codon:yes stop_codon:yes gene_type:complete